jgi:hypothetical protein
VQSSLGPRAHQKLAYCFFEPFHVLVCVSSVAIKLELLDHSSIHLVFHVSQLKHAIGVGNQVTPVLPYDFAMKLVPEQDADHGVCSSSCAANRSSSCAANLDQLEQPTPLPRYLEDFDALHQEFPVPLLRSKQYFF